MKTDVLKIFRDGIDRLEQKLSSLETAWQATSGNFRQVEGFGGQVLKKVLEGSSHLDPVAFDRQVVSRCSSDLGDLVR